MARLRSDFWVAAYLRLANRDGVRAVLRRRGSAEAGAVYVKLDHLDGRFALFGPAPGDADGEDRRFLRLHRDEWIDGLDAEARLAREVGFDGDLWIVEVEDGDGDPGLAVVAV